MLIPIIVLKRGNLKGIAVTSQGIYPAGNSLTVPDTMTTC